MKAIELKNVTFSYNGSAKVLDDVDYSAEYGEVSLLSGHSGAGKSTFMHIVSGIIPNVNFGELSGDVIIDGENIKGKKLGDVCRKVGVVMQNADEQIVQKRVEDEIAFASENQISNRCGVQAYGDFSRMELPRIVGRSEAEADNRVDACHGAENTCAGRAACQPRQGRCAKSHANAQRTSIVGLLRHRYRT